jgi:hypothetical protein
MQLFLSHLESPLGDMLLVTDAQQTVHALDFADRKARLHRGLREHYGNAHRHRRAMSSRHLEQWRSQGLRVGSSPEALVARAREGDSSRVYCDANCDVPGILTVTQPPWANHSGISVANLCTAM